MGDAEFEARLKGAGLLTAEILYVRPDCRGLVQTFLWQAVDTAPSFPRLKRFLDHWRDEIRAEIRSVHIAHDDGLGPVRVRLPAWESRLAH